MRSMQGGYVYIMTNKTNGTLYIGVTSDIAARAMQHRSGTGSEFCKQYDLTRLVLIEPYPTIVEAIAREKTMKAWKRGWKLRLISATNPDWDDLYLTLNA
jgi:putative endonuclease